MKPIDAIYFRLKQLCDEKSMTLRQLCKKVGISPSLAYQFEHGLKKGISFSTLHRLCEGLGITPADFLKDDLFEPFNDLKNLH